MPPLGPEERKQLPMLAGILMHSRTDPIGSRHCGARTATKSVTNISAELRGTTIPGRAKSKSEFSAACHAAGNWSTDRWDLRLLRPNRMDDDEGNGDDDCDGGD